MVLSTQETRVERARYGGVFRAFDDGAAIGEDGQFVGWDAKAEQEIVVANFRRWRRSETAAEIGEIEFAAALVDLNGIAAAHRDLRLRLAIEINEFTAHAGAAIGIARHADGLKFSGPNIARDQASVHGFRLSAQKLEGFARLDGSNGADGGVKNASGVAGGFCALGARAIFTFQQAGQAG